MGPEQGDTLLVEGRCTQTRLQLVPTPTEVLTDGSRQLGPHKLRQAGLARARVEIV